MEWSNMCRHGGAFWARSALKIFSTVADALQYILQEHAGNRAHIALSG